jgi:hypothetical protein
MISKQMKSKQARRHVKMQKKMQKGRSFGKANDLRLPIFPTIEHNSEWHRFDERKIKIPANTKAK